MGDWSHGYNVSQGYTYGYFRELSPDWLRTAALLAGHRAPGDTAEGAPFRYLELGSGQGVGLALLAAACPQGDFLGIDFHPAHVAHSDELAAAAGLDNVRFVEGDFADLAKGWPVDFGQFDFAALHGIYSWVPVALRRAVVDCLDAGLAPGGLAYLSYNSMPGWASTLPFQHMLRRIEQAGGRSGEQAIAEGIALFETFEAGGAALINALPTLKARIAAVKGQSAPYLVQEYLHENWHPLWFSQVAQELGAAKLSHVVTATFAESLLPAALPEALREAAFRHTDPVMRQEVIDCAINQAFRRDIFARGGRKRFGPVPLDAIQLHRIGDADGDTMKVETTYGELVMRAEVYRPILSALDAGPMSLGRLVALDALAAEGQANVVQAVTLLIHAGEIGIGAAPVDHRPAHRLNAVIARAARQGAPYGHVAAPILGSAVVARDIDLILLDAVHEGMTESTAALVPLLLERLDRLGRRLSDDGRPLEGAAGHARAEVLVDDFLGRLLPRWRRLGVTG